MVPRDDGSFAVKFPCGGTAIIYRFEDGYSYTGSRRDGAKIDLDSHFGLPLSEAWIRLLGEMTSGPPAISTPVDQIHSLAKLCDGNRDLFAKTLKRLLFERVGIRFSVRCGTGSVWGWVDVRTKTPEERLALASVFGPREACDGTLSVPSRGGVRIWAICTAAGVPTPEGFVLRRLDV